MNTGPLFLRRLGRYLLWRNPRLYRPIGLLRGRGDCAARDFDVWIGGFPRSANTFALEAFQLANPAVRVASHHHIPAFIIAWLDSGRPGFFLIRQPEDAVISWSILWNGHLEESLDYYVDFHRAMLPYLPRLFVATFEEVTSDFGEVIRRFNRRNGTDYVPFPHDAGEVSKCFSLIERNSPLSGSDLTICRPSARRQKTKTGLVEQLRASPALCQKLQQANGLYAVFRNLPVTPGTVDRPTPEGCSAFPDRNRNCSRL